MTVKPCSPTIYAPADIKKNYEERLGIKYTGIDYLSKEKAIKLFGLGGCIDREKESSQYGYFVDTNGKLVAFYQDISSFLFGKKSVVIFKQSDVDIERFKDVGWLAKKISATQN